MQGRMKEFFSSLLGKKTETQDADVQVIAGRLHHCREGENPQRKKTGRSGDGVCVCV